MAVWIEQILTYGIVFLICVVIVYYYLRQVSKASNETKKKVEVAKEEGRFEPISLHPYINLSSCIGSGACITACPEKDILGIVDGKATVINATNCIGHGACFHACPVEAISLRIGTETRGVELPHVNENFETTIRGLFIAGELGGMGLIKNSVEQGQQAVQNIVKANKPKNAKAFDLVIIGAGPAGIAAALEAKKSNLNAVVLEQYTLGGTVYSFPRSKIVMTAPMDLPLYGRVKLFNTSKDELLGIWNEAISQNELEVRENTKVESIIPVADELFKIVTSKGDDLLANNVLLAIGRRGTPRKLGIEGEELEKVSYRLLEPEMIEGKRIIVVGGGDSAVESALLLKDNNDVILSYRKDKFARIKVKNREKVLAAKEDGSLNVIYNSNLVFIDKESALLKVNGEDDKRVLNDLVYIFAGGELPTGFLKKAGIEITKRFGYIVKKHR